MKRQLILTLAFAAGSAFGATTSLGGDYAHYDRAARWHNATQSWHGPYSHAAWGRPMALIVPPTANMQTEYAWGVGRTRMAPINHQFARPYALPNSGQTRATPIWPWDTSQFGIYSVRGPW